MKGVKARFIRIGLFVVGGALASVRRVFVLGAGSALGCAIMAAAGSGVGWLSHAISSSEVASYWKSWWLGDWTGILVLTPLARASSRRP